MKKAPLFLFAVLLAVFTLTTSAQRKVMQSEVVATFTGINDDYQFMFTGEKNEKLLFDEIDAEVEIDLYDDGFIGTKFKIQWAEDRYDDYDDDGNSTGDVVTIRRITSLTAL